MYALRIEFEQASPGRCARFLRHCRQHFADRLVGHKGGSFLFFFPSAEEKLTFADRITQSFTRHGEAVALIQKL